MEHATRGVRVLGATMHPGGDWIIRQARNLLMDFDDTGGAHIGFVLHDRDAPFQQGFDGVFTAADTRVVRSGVRVPRMSGTTTNTGPATTSRARRRSRRCQPRSPTSTPSAPTDRAASAASSTNINRQPDQYG
jgi:hypothetical protein